MISSCCPCKSKNLCSREDVGYLALSSLVDSSVYPFPKKEAKIEESGPSREERLVSKLSGLGNEVPPTADEFFGRQDSGKSISGPDCS